MKRAFFVLVVAFASQFVQASMSPEITGPDTAKTPGILCTANDPNFEGYFYNEHVPRCRRNIAEVEKEAVAAAYGGIPKNEWPNYEFDHLIPLCAGGSNDQKNLWPQPLAEAHQKDTLENDICLGMQAGTMTQAEAVQKVHEWFQNRLIGY